MDLSKLAGQARKLVDRRGGTDSLKADAEELLKVAQGQGSLADKGKAAAAALKEPGAREAEAAASAPVEPASAATPAPAPPAE